MKILVTGGAGFIGSNIVEELVKEKEEVLVIDDLSTGDIENLKGVIRKIEFVNGSILNEKDLDKVGKVNFILHQAAIPSVPKSVKDPLKTSKVNIIGTLNVLEFARKNDVEKVVIASSSSIYGDSKELPKREDMPYNPKSPYALAKVTNEMHAKLYYKLYGLKTVSLRYFNVYGPRQNPKSEYAAVIPKFITKMLRGESPVIYGDGKQTRDFTYVKDVVEANLKAIESKKANGEAINIAGGNSISLLQLVEKINNILGTDIKPRFEKEREGDIKHSLADVSKAERLLGWKAKTKIEEGLEKTVLWYKNR